MCAMKLYPCKTSILQNSRKFRIAVINTMARANKKNNGQPLTTAQRLSSIVKSCRDIMRKDKGLNGDLDRLPMLTWIMFLKFLDDMEQIAEQEAR